MKFLPLLFAATLAACGAGGQNPNPDGHISELKAGQSWTMGKNQTLKVPAGTTLTAPSTTTGAGATTTVISGTNKVDVGTVVSVPSSATGPADNIVTTLQ